MLNQVEACSALAHLLLLERCKRNLTQRMVADFVQLGVSTVYRAERGEPVSAYARQRLCEFFGKTAQELGLAFSEMKKRSAFAALPTGQGQ